MPRLAYESHYGDIAVDFDSSRRVRARTNRYRMWITQGVKRGDSTWRSGFDPNVVCLHLFNRVGNPVAFQCAPRSEAMTELGKVFVLISGGADGAPGLRPHEVLVAGLAPIDAAAMRVVSDRGAAMPVEVEDGGFVFLTRSNVSRLTVSLFGGEVEQLPMDGCQDC